MHPLGLASNDPAVGLTLSDLMSRHALCVHRDPLLFVVSAPVSDDYLGRVFVGHHHRGLWES